MQLLQRTVRRFLAVVVCGMGALTSFLLASHLFTPSPHVDPCVQEDRRVRKMLRVDVAERVKEIERKYQEARRKFHQRARNREKLRLQIANRKKRKREASRR